MTILGTVHKYFGGGLGKMEGGQKSFELPEGGGDQKVFRTMRGGQKSFAKLIG